MCNAECSRCLVEAVLRTQFKVKLGYVAGWPLGRAGLCSAHLFVIVLKVILVFNLLSFYCYHSCFCPIPRLICACLAFKSEWQQRNCEYCTTIFGLASCKKMPGQHFEKKLFLTAFSLFYKRREKNSPHVIYSASLMSYYITYFLMPGLILSPRPSCWTPNHDLLF